MDQTGKRKQYGISLRILILLTAVFVILTEAAAPGLAAGGESPYGLYVSDLAGGEGYYHATLSQGAANIIRRGRQMYEIKWIAQGDIKSYPGTGQELIFRKGVEYQGIPYGQPVHQGKYVGFDATVDEFAAAAADPDSELYTTPGENTWDYTQGLGNIKYAPFYSSDCSAFISYVWELPGRFTTSMIAERTRKKGDKGYQDAQFQYVGNRVSDLRVGYGLNKGSSHIILVYDIVYDKHDKIVQVTTLEETPPFMRLRVWGAGGSAGSLDDLQEKIDGAPYEIIKYKDMDTVTFTESGAVPLNAQQYTNRISSPVSNTVSDAAASGSAKLQNGAFTIEGWTHHKNGVTAVEYCIGEERTEWKQMETEPFGELLRFRADADLSEAGQYLIFVRGASAGKPYEIAEFTVNVGEKAPKYSVNFDRLGNFSNVSEVNKAVSVIVSLSAPSKSSFSFTGWSVCEDGVKGYEYKLDDGLWLPLEAGFRMDVYRSAKAYQQSCAAFNQFTGGMGFGSLVGGTAHTLYIRGVTNTNGVYDMGQIRFTLGRSVFEFFGFELTMFELLIVIIVLVVILAAAATLIVLVCWKKKKNKKGKPADAIEAQEGQEQEKIVGHDDKDIDS